MSTRSRAYPWWGERRSFAREVANHLLPPLTNADPVLGVQAWLLVNLPPRPMGNLSGVTERRGWSPEQDWRSRLAASRWIH